MLWPPIRYSYKTHQSRQLPVPAPSPPTWMLSEAQCRAAGCACLKGRTANCRDLEWNWLGTDDQGRDVLARLLYGFRLSVLFGLTLAGISSIVGVAAGAVQGYFGGWTDLIFQRFIEIWSSLPQSLFADHRVVDHHAELLRAARHLLLFSWVSLVHVVRAEFLRARNFEYVQRRPRAWALAMAPSSSKHVLPNAMVATLTFLPFVLNSSITTLTALDFWASACRPVRPRSANFCCRANPICRRPGSASPAFPSSRSCFSLLVFIGEAVRDAFDPRKTLQLNRSSLVDIYCGFRGRRPLGDSASPGSTDHRRR